MKAWLKGGLIGAGVSLIYSLISITMILFALKSSQPSPFFFILTLLFLIFFVIGLIINRGGSFNRGTLFEGPQWTLNQSILVSSLIISSIILLILGFFIGAIIGLRIGKIKSKK